MDKDSSFSALEYGRLHLNDFDLVEKKVRRCPVVASLRSVNDALTKLTFRSDSSASEIAEVIRRDSSLTARLLRLVNSVFGGLTVKVTSIEEAIFFLGLRQIRQLAMTTRVIEEMEAFMDERIEATSSSFWRHSIATAILTREILTMTHGVMEDDTYYIVGLLSDIGKLVMLNAFPEQLKQSVQFEAEGPTEHLLHERAEFGFTHADLGAIYLEQNGLTPEMVEAVLFHHEPDAANESRPFAAGVQVADALARHAGCQPGFEKPLEVEFGAWESLPGWQLLFANERAETQYARASVLRSIESLPSLLQGLLDVEHAS